MPLRPDRYQPPKPKRIRSHKASSTARGYDVRWRRARLRFLSANPLCLDCQDEGHAVPATDIDHKIPVNGPLDPNFWRTDLWRQLCHSHHSRKTVREDGGFGRLNAAPE